MMITQHWQWPLMQPHLDESLFILLLIDGEKAGPVSTFFSVNNHNGNTMKNIIDAFDQLPGSLPFFLWKYPWISYIKCILKKVILVISLF